MKNNNEAVETYFRKMSAFDRLKWKSLYEVLINEIENEKKGAAPAHMLPHYKLGLQTIEKIIAE